MGPSIDESDKHWSAHWNRNSGLISRIVNEVLVCYATIELSYYCHI